MRTRGDEPRHKKSTSLPDPFDPFDPSTLFGANQTAQIEEIIEGCEHNLEGPELVARLKSLTPEDDVLKTKLKDHPMFMFSTVEGKTHEHQIFHDAGNSHPANL